VKSVHLGSLLEAALVDLHATNIKQQHQMQTTSMQQQRHLSQRLLTCILHAAS
jgi:hypothetical protein